MQGPGLKRFKRIFIEWYVAQQAAGKDRQTICEMVGIKSATLDKWINSTDDRAPSCENLLKVANAIGCTVDYLIREGAAESRDPDITNAAACTGLSEKAVKDLSIMKKVFRSEAALIDTILSAEFVVTEEEDGSYSGKGTHGILSAIADYFDVIVAARNKLSRGEVIPMEPIEYQQFKTEKTIRDTLEQITNDVNHPLLKEYIRIRHPSSDSN